MSNQLNKYSEQIKDVARFARREKFNPETDDLMELIRKWVKYNLKTWAYIEDNKGLVGLKIKSLLDCNTKRLERKLTGILKEELVGNDSGEVAGCKDAAKRIIQEVILRDE